jgi:hypothetical protein
MNKNTTTENKSWEYDVKCRRCGKITRMYFSTKVSTTGKDFKLWATEHSNFPIQKQCEYDNGMIMFHDIVSFGNALDISLDRR